jgi:hypothetical protein
MEQLQKISLNTSWQYIYSAQSEDYSSVIRDNSDWSLIDFADVPTLAHASHNVLWLQQRFDLMPTDVCVRYFLRCVGYSYSMTVYLRGQEIAQSDKVGLNVDVTDYVSLDDNVLVFAIRLNKQTIATQQVDIYLQPILCDDIN